MSGRNEAGASAPATRNARELAHVVAHPSVRVHPQAKTGERDADDDERDPSLLPALPALGNLRAALPLLSCAARAAIRELDQERFLRLSCSTAG